LIGKKRAAALAGHELVAVFDIDASRAGDVASMASNAKVAVDLDQILKDPDINIVIVSTTNDHLSRLSIMAANAKKHVLVEKPAGRNVKEITAIADAARKNGVIVKVGFNHRFHPALLKAKEIVASGILGDLMFLRGRYGHGGRLGYEKEWRANPEMSGGGELIDQGVHLIDLSRMFLGDFTRVEGYAGTYFWDMRVDDNAFMQLRTKDDRVAWLHVSCTEWKNMFSFEIYGKYGKLQIDGLGGSYGTEKLTCYKMLPQMGPPETEVWEYPSPDRSWELEFKDFINAIEKKRQPEGNIMDAIKALEIVKKIYEVSK